MGLNFSGPPVSVGSGDATTSVKGVVQLAGDLAGTAALPTVPVLTTHVARVDNPHVTTKAQVGLGSVDNTSDAAKPVSTAQAAADALLIPLTQKGAASGVASLGSDSKVPSAQLPAIAITSVSVVATQAAQLALVAQEGDLAVRSDLSKSFIHNGGVAGTIADWTELQTPVDAVLSVAGRTGSVVLVKGDVGLGLVDNTSDVAKPVSTAQQTALDLKAPLASPTFTGVAAAPTATALANTTQLATTAYADTADSVAKGLPRALTGATAATRYVGGTASGAPATGTFAVGDFVVDQTGKVWVNTTAGTPGTWTQVGAGAAGAPEGGFGNGSDGDSTVSTSVSLTRDMYYNNLTVTGAGSVFAAGWRVFVRGTLTIASGGVVHHDGLNAGAGGTVGAAFSAGNSSSVGRGSGGGAGSSTTGGAGAAQSGFNDALAGVGGTGGAATNAGGVGGARNVSFGGYTQLPKSGPDALSGVVVNGVNVSGFAGVQGGTGGGGAGGDGTVLGGGGGGGAGVLLISARTLVNGGRLSANGGTGAGRAAGNVGGGGGGGGGIIIANTNAYSGAGVVTATGGAGGAGFGTGAAGAAGGPGTTTTNVWT